MKYNLAKELNDAGFVPKQMPANDRLYRNPYPFLYELSLSELIEACGDDISSLSRADRAGSRIWIAKCCDRTQPYHRGSGPTPEEAVARLWLALNRKEA